MKRISIICTAALSLAAVSCMVEHIETPSAKNTITFSATLDSPDTKTSLVDGKKVYWTAEDNIAVFSGTASTYDPFTASNIDGTKADFTGFADTEAESYVAVYPVSNSLKLNSSSNYETTLPYYQKAVKGGFDNNLNLTAAKTSADDKYLSFKNLCALVKVTVPAELEDIAALTLMSGDMLAGRVIFNFDESGNPVMVKEDNTGTTGFKEITLASEDGSALEAGDYYFVIRPSSSTLPEGSTKHKFSVGITTTNGEVYSIVSSTEIDVNANDIINLGTVSLTNAKTFKVTNAPVGDFPMGVEQFTIAYSGGTPKSYSNRNSSIIEKIENGVVYFKKNVYGPAHVYVECDGAKCPIVFNITQGYYAETFESEDGANWAVSLDHISKKGAKQEWVSETNGNYIKCTPGADKKNDNDQPIKGRADILRCNPNSVDDGTVPTYFTRDYPIICIKIDDVSKSGDYTRNITLNAVSATGSQYAGAIGGNNNAGLYKYDCGDDSRLLVYDLSQQHFGTDKSNILPEGTIEEYKKIELKYADIQNKSDNTTVIDLDALAYRFFWFRTFKSITHMESFLTDWSKETGITVTKL